MTITAGTFAWVADVVRRRSAIVLEPGKEYLVESRLTPLALQAGLPDVDAFVARARLDPGESLHDAVVEALSTHETSWFRDVAPFGALRDHVVPAWRAAAGPARRLQVWSAACATGQEPYSLVMALSDQLGGALDVLATDLSEAVLERARRGVYTQLEINRGLPAALLVRHLTRAGAGWQVADEVRRAVTFRRHNLLHQPPYGPFDVVLLRNVLIYFDVDTKRAVLAAVHRVLRPGGWLVLGGAETTTGLHDGFERHVVAGTPLYRAVEPVRVPSPFPTTGLATLPTPRGALVPAAAPAPPGLAPSAVRGAPLR